MNFDGFDFDDNIKQTLNTLDIQGRVPHAIVIESRQCRHEELRHCLL